jgi:hypothetical protein
MVGEIAAHQDADRVFLSVAVGGGAVLIGDLNAAEILAQPEIDHPRHGIGAVHRRRAAGDDIDAFDQRHRDHVEVDRPVGIGRHQTLPIEQHESALRTEAAQVGVGLAALEAGRALHVADLGQALGAGELRHLTESGVQRHLPRGGDLRRAHRDQRTVRRIARVRDAAARHDHLIQHRVGAGCRGRRGRRLGAGHSRHAQ